MFTTSYFTGTGLKKAYGAYLTYAASKYYVQLCTIYDDAGSGAGSIYLNDCNTDFPALAQTSWFDFSNDEMLKAITRAKIFTASTGVFTGTLYADESATAIAGPSNFVALPMPYAEDKKFWATLKATGDIDVAKHRFSILITFPTVGLVADKIEDIQFAFVNKSKVEGEI